MRPVARMLCVVMVSLSGMLPCALGDEDFSLGLDLTYSGKYVWRGVNVVDDHVLQPSLTAGWRGFSVNVWGNRDLTSENGSANDFTEIDFTADYSWTHGPAALSVGAIRYIFPHSGGHSTTEFYGSVALDMVLSPSLTVYQDVEEADGTYVSMAVGHSIDEIWRPSEGVTAGLELGLSVGMGSSEHNRFYYGAGGGALSDLLLTVGLPVQMGEHSTLTPFLNYSSLLDGQIRDAMSDDSNLWGGLSLAVSF